MVTAAGSNFNILYALRCFGKRSDSALIARASFIDAQSRINRFGSSRRERPFTYFLSEDSELDSVFALLSFFEESLLLSDSDFELDPADDFFA